MERRPSRSIFANPVLVGAVTVLVLVVAVFLAYNANKGLPFVPTRELKVQVSNGANLLPGNEVREGGQRVGLVSEMQPVTLPNGETGAEIVMHLDQTAGEIPTDSTINLRPRSVLGLKYVELTRGKATKTIADGGTLPATQASFPVELDEFYSTFDEPTRQASQTNLRGFGDMFTQRGGALNATIQRAPDFMTHLAPVAEVLADPDTQLKRFFNELGDAARIVRPVAGRYAHSFVAAADTFEAWSRYPEQLRQTVERSADTLQTGTASLRVQRPFLVDLASMSKSLHKAANELPTALPALTPALQAGARVQPRATALNDELQKTMASLGRLVRDPSTTMSLRGLADTGQILNPLLKYLGPYITVCNYFNYAWTHASEHLTEPDATGTAQRTMLNQASRTVNPLDTSVGSTGARTPANGEPVLVGANMNLHANAYGAAIDKNGKADCESGQRGYMERLATYHPKDRNIVVDPRTPGNQGPTFTGLAQVPPGQTFSRETTAGPKINAELDP